VLLAEVFNDLPNVARAQALLDQVADEYGLASVRVRIDARLS
jgi:hypothetical protein